MRIRVCLWMMGASFVGSFVMMIYGRKLAKDGDSLGKRERTRVAKLRGEQRGNVLSRLSICNSLFKSIVMLKMARDFY